MNVKSKEVAVTKLPKCDFCEKKAQYDAKTKFGSWANVCPDHFEKYCYGMGMGKAQRLIVASLLCFLIVGCVPAMAKTPPLSSENAIKAIIGEAEGEGEAGMQAVACAIYNRGNLKGVYGINSPRVRGKKFSYETYVSASTAWDLANESAESNKNYCGYIKGATGWGTEKDMSLFQKTKWFGKCQVTTKVNNHFFYKCEDLN